MEQVVMDGEHKKSTPQSPLIEVSYTFNASVDRVWRAWSDPEMLKQWWGPAGFSAPSARADFRVGGKYLFAMKNLDGRLTWTTGQYLKIIPHQLIVCTDQFADEQGIPHSPHELSLPEEFGDGEPTYVTIEFVDREDSTEIHLSHEGLPALMHDDCLNGWISSLDKMQALLESH